MDLALKHLRILASKMLLSSFDLGVCYHILGAALLSSMVLGALRSWLFNKSRAWVMAHKII